MSYITVFFQYLNGEEIEAGFNAYSDSVYHVLRKDKLLIHFSNDFKLLIKMKNSKIYSSLNKKGSIDSFKPINGMSIRLGNNSIIDITCDNDACEISSKPELGKDYEYTIAHRIREVVYDYIRSCCKHNN